MFGISSYVFKKQKQKTNHTTLSIRIFFFFLIAELAPATFERFVPDVTALLVAMHAVSTYPLLVLQQFLGLVLIQLLDAVKTVSTVGPAETGAGSAFVRRRRGKRSLKA